MPGPWTTILHILPEIGKGFDRHIRMAHDIVWLTNQLSFSKATDIKEVLVDIGNLSLEISF
jgi:hypothetical protein